MPFTCIHLCPTIPLNPAPHPNPIVSTQTKPKTQESAETVAELICRNKPPVIADVEPLTKGQ